ncbi:MAG: response regulator [Salinivirgaceae bacterium]
MQNQLYKILIVDDNPNNIQLLGSILSSAGYEAEFATNGFDALDWVATDHFDIILLDIMMPEMDGYEVCKRLKKNEKTAHIPVIYITAKQDTESIVEAFETGAVDYISKPFKEQELLARLGYHLELLTTKRKLEILNRELQEKNDTMMQSIRYAEKLQEAMLPHQNMIKQSFADHFILFRPLQHLSGDFYWAKKMGNKTLFILGDSMGHGVPGALLSMLGISSLNEITNNNSDLTPATILTELRNREKDTFGADAGMMHDSIDMAACLFDHETKTVTFSGANLPLSIVTEKPLEFEKQPITKVKTINNTNKHLITLNGHKNTIGKNVNEETFKNTTVKLNQNDTVFLYSDGFPDQFGGIEGKKYMKKNFLKLLVDTHTLPLQKQAAKIQKEYTQWLGSNPQIDDVTVIGIQLY